MFKINTYFYNQTFKKDNKTSKKSILKMPYYKVQIYKKNNLILIFAFAKWFKIEQHLPKKTLKWLIFFNIKNVASIASSWNAAIFIQKANESETKQFNGFFYVKCIDDPHFCHCENLFIVIINQCTSLLYHQVKHLSFS